MKITFKKEDILMALQAWLRSLLREDGLRVTLVSDRPAYISEIELDIVVEEPLEVGEKITQVAKIFGMSRQDAEKVFLEFQNQARQRAQFEEQVNAPRRIDLGLGQLSTTAIQGRNVVGPGILGGSPTFAIPDVPPTNYARDQEGGE